MKRLLALAALVLAASACTTTTTNMGAGNTNANTNANAAAASQTPAGPTQADIEAQERQILDAIKAKNWDAFAGLLADDFTLVGGDGVMTKAETLDSIKKYDLTEYTLADARFLRVDADLAVLTYTLTEKSSYEGKPTPGKPFRASSAWASRGGKWVNVYHQESEVAETAPAPSPTPAATPAASPAASPAATPPAPVSATDAEKAVWAALQSRNYDAFANFLLPESLEVEPERVYTKEESLAAVRQFDASKFTQSEFKEVKIDADATLVTYKVSGPMAGKTVTEYHSTIWTNRGGQWKATFHQGSRQSSQ